MAIRFTNKKKDYTKDERTFNATEYIKRAFDSKKSEDRVIEIPNTEGKK